SPSRHFKMPASSIAAVIRITRERRGKRATRFLLDEFAELAPGDEFDLVFLKQLAKGVAGEEFKIALAPGGAPIRMIGRCALHFSVVVGEVDDDLRHA